MLAGMDGTSALTVAREKKGLRQADVAQQLEVTQATISNWETGTAIPHPSKWNRIAEVYGITFRKLAEHCGAVAS